MMSSEEMNIEVMYRAISSTWWGRGIISAELLRKV